MVDQNTRGVDGPRSEVLATIGLMTMLGSVLGAVIAVVALGSGSAALGAILGAIAVISFGTSLACFAIDSARSEGAPLPFPSWLRTETEPAAELPA